MIKYVGEGTRRGGRPRWARSCAVPYGEAASNKEGGACLPFLKPTKERRADRCEWSLLSASSYQTGPPVSDGFASPGLRRATLGWSPAPAQAGLCRLDYAGRGDGDESSSLSSSDLGRDKRGELAGNRKVEAGHRETELEGQGDASAGRTRLCCEAAASSHRRPEPLEREAHKGVCGSSRQAHNTSGLWSN